FHALTVDLAGGYITHFADGRCAAASGWAGRELGPEPAVRPADDRLRAVAQQTARFERLAQRYREALAGTDPAALALLERICLFRLGLDADLLAQIFTGPGNDDLSLTWPGCPPPRFAPGWISSWPCACWKRRSPARPAGGSDRCALYEILAQFGAEISSGIPLFSGYVS